MEQPDKEGAREYFIALPKSLFDEIARYDCQAEFLVDAWTRDEGGGGISRVLADGKVFEKAAVNFSHITGSDLPPSASKVRPELAGRSYEAMGDRKSTRLNSSHVAISYAVFCLKKK